MRRQIVRWTLSLLMLATLVAGPLVYFRWRFENTRRLRVVAPGVLYRSGRMSAEGLRDTIRRLQIKTVVNLWNSQPDPLLDGERRESEVCDQLGARHVYLPVELVDPRIADTNRPVTIDRFLTIMDDPSNHPVLIHCRAGVHRAGIHSALYRMEYEGWSTLRAMEELKDMGFGRSACHAHNLYVAQYVLDYQPRWKVSPAEATATPGKPFRSPKEYGR